MTNDRPLAGVKIIDFSTYAAGPAAARILADQGAEVIKIEATTGDPYRFTGALMAIPVKDGYCPGFDIENANKQLVCIDVRTDQGQEIFHKLLAQADVLITNYRTDALTKLKARYEDLKDLYPRLVYGYVSGYGELGPLASDPGYDSVAYFARSGFMLDTVTSDSYPLINVGACGDHPTAVALAQGVASALVKQVRTGKGEKVSVSLYHAAIWAVGSLMVSTQFGANYPKQYSNPPLTPLVHPYKCADGEWVFPMLLDFKYFGSLCETLGVPELATDPNFNTPLAARKNQDQLMTILIERIKTKAAEEWSQTWKKLDIPHEVLRHMKDIYSDEQALVNDYVRKVEYANGKQVYLPTSPIQFPEIATPEYNVTDRVGVDTLAVLRNLGYSEECARELETVGVVKL